MYKNEYMSVRVRLKQRPIKGVDTKFVIVKGVYKR